jgi:hypothetical protein
MRGGDRVSARVTFEGLDELRDALRQLPSELVQEASGIVQRAADNAAQDIRANYQAHRRSGNLAEHVKVVPMSVGQFGAGVEVRSTAKHAHLYEDGTQARHTSIGANRGSMPPGHAFRPPAIRRRKSMYDALKAMLVRHGLIVSGEP